MISVHINSIVFAAKCCAFSKEKMKNNKDSQNGTRGPVSGNKLPKSHIQFKSSVFKTLTALSGCVKYGHYGQVLTDQKDRK